MDNAILLRVFLKRVLLQLLTPRILRVVCDDTVKLDYKIKVKSQLGSIDNYILFSFSNNFYSGDIHLAQCTEISPCNTRKTLMQCLSVIMVIIVHLPPQLC
jgi:hypothetical protein